MRKEVVLVGLTQYHREKRFEDISCVGRKLHYRIVESNTESAIPLTLAKRR